MTWKDACVTLNTFDEKTREELIAELQELQAKQGSSQGDRATSHANIPDPAAQLEELEAERSKRVEAERIGRIKDEFLANLSHELRTPLNAILGWSQILKPGVTADEEMAEGLRVIQRNVRVQVQLIDDLLDMSRIISGKLRLDVQRIELPHVIQAAVEAVQLAADAKGLRLEVIVDPIAGPITGDPNRMQQVVWNLLANAIKFTPRGGKVQVTLERTDSHVELSVSDTGQGISPEFLPHVFDKFSQAEAPWTKTHAGLGLGLTIVKHLVEMHGGSIRVKSAGEGKGATFVVSLPISVVRTQKGDEDRQHPTTAREIEFSPDPDLSGVDVLVVDDDADALQLMKHVLENRGAHVTRCSSGLECLEILRGSQPGVLIADIGMPGMDGYSLIQRVRALTSGEGGATPAIALTAFARSEDRRRAMLAGFDMHMAKPVEPGELVAVVARLARRS
jgi:signal transduction histidine kinase/ActR/RegA family two-component response regulator